MLQSQRPLAVGLRLPGQGLSRLKLYLGIVSHATCDFLAMSGHFELTGAMLTLHAHDHVCNRVRLIASLYAAERAQISN